MADNRYTPKVYRKLGGASFVVASSGAIDVESGGEVNIESGGTIDIESGGTLHFESGGYSYSDAAQAHTTQLSVLKYGVWNTVSNASTGLTLLLPTAYPGAEVWFQSYDATTGAFPIATSTAGVSILIGSSTEAGVFADANTAIQTSGNIIGFKAVATSHWVVISNVGASACSTYTTALASTA